MGYQPMRSKRSALFLRSTGFRPGFQPVPDSFRSRGCV